MVRGRGLYADVLGSNPARCRQIFSFFFEKNLVFLALGFKGFGSRV